MADIPSWEEIAARVGVRMKAYREEHSLQQKDLAELTHLSRPQVSRYELGTEVPNTRNLMLLAETMDITVDELLWGKRDAIPIPDPILRERVLILEALSPHHRTALIETMDYHIWKATSEALDVASGPGERPDGERR